VVPVGNYEQVMPRWIPAIAAFIWNLAATRIAKALGYLELDEEDLALCAPYMCAPANMV
jgi:Na+-transporting NADH:ubiquinone oxidoreductase subunit NqrA